MPQFIYTMKGLGKIYPPDSQVLKDIWLSFLPGAKIGVLGLNGSGKSTLLKIMAGDDHDFVGEAFPADGITVGYLSQEPALDPAKTVLGIVDEGVSEVRALLQRFDEINEKFAQDLSPEEMEKVLEEQARMQDRIEAAGAWELDSKLDLAMEALRLPPPDVEVKTLSGGERRRVALCRLLLRAPDLLLLDEPTNHLDPNAAPHSGARLPNRDCPIRCAVAHATSRRSVTGARWSLQSGRQHANSMGTLHGGVLCDDNDLRIWILD